MDSNAVSSIIMLVVLAFLGFIAWKIVKNIIKKL